MKMKIMVIEHNKDLSEARSYYDAVRVEIKWVNEAEWYCWVIHCQDGSTATFTCGHCTVYQWSDIYNLYKEI